MFIKIMWSIIFMFLLAFIWGCVPETKLVPPQVRGIPLPVENPGEKASWEIEWENTLDKAKKESKVIVVPT